MTINRSEFPFPKPVTFAAAIVEEPAERIVKASGRDTHEAKRDQSQRSRPASFGIISFECRPASIWILRTRKNSDRLATSRFLIVTQRHHGVASRFNSSGTTVSARPAAARKAALLDLHLKFFEKPHKENEAFRTENLSIDTHTY